MLVLRMSIHSFSQEILFQAYLGKFLTKFVGECNEKDIPFIKDQWRNLMIDRLEEALEQPYKIEVFSFKYLVLCLFILSFL